jgi:transposase
LRVSDRTELLSDDIEALRNLVRSAFAERDAVSAERDAAVAERDRAIEQIDRLRHLLRELQRARFGRSSERLDPDQLQLALEEIEQAVARAEAELAKHTAAPAKSRPPRQGERPSLPAHLPRIEVVIAPEDTACPCCKGPMHVIGEEKSERLDVIPAQHRVLVTRRPKYACRACSGAVVQAPAPERLIKGGLPTEAMVAHVLVSKYAWHLPLYRQAQMLASQGIVIDLATLDFWVGYAREELAPVVARLRTSCSPRSSSLSMRHRFRCSIPVAGAPRSDTSGRWRATTGRGAAASLLRSPTPMHRGAGRSMPSRCSPVIAASCSATAMRPTSNWPTAGAPAGP